MLEWILRTREEMSHEMLVLHYSLKDYRIFLLPLLTGELNGSSFVPICFLFYHLNIILFSKISYHITYAFSKKPRLIKNNLKTTVLTIQPNFLLNGIRLLLKRPIFNLAS